LVPVTVVFLKKIVDCGSLARSHWPNDSLTRGCLDENFTQLLSMWMKSGHLNYLKQMGNLDDHAGYCE
jgi:hypothetical protein